MQYGRLGNTGLKVSRICLGMMSFGQVSSRPWGMSQDQAEPLVEHAVEAGVNFFDTADVYNEGQSEEITGRLLAKFFANRDDYVLATKVFSQVGERPNERGLSRKHIMAGVDNSLRRLGTDYIDLYQIHRWDYETPIEETMQALHDLVRSGKVRYIGASSMFAWQFAKAQSTAERHGWTPFVSMQNHYNLVYREEEREMIPLCIDQGVGLIPWSPLARGLLTGSRGRGGERNTVRAANDTYGDSLYVEEHDFDVVDVVRAIAGERGASAAQVSLAWMLGKPGITAPIIGATKLPHVEDALKAVDLTLTTDEVARLEAPYRPHAIKGHV